MEVKVGYKPTEVGVIPEDWQSIRVGDLCNFIVPGRNKPKIFDGDIPWITTPDLEDGKSVTISRLGLCISHAEAKAVGSKVVPPGSVLMSCAGELGIVALTQSEIVVNQQLHVFIPTERIDGRFLLFALAYRKDQIASYGTKTAVPYLNKDACNSIPIPLPPLLEQRAIASVLSDVDALLGALERLITKKRDLKQGVMQQLLTGKTRLPGFHGQSEIKRLGEIADIKTGPFGSSLHESDYVQDGTPIITVEHLGEFGIEQFNLPKVSNHDRQRLRAYALEIDDIVFSRVGSVDRNALIGCTEEGWLFSGRLLRVRPDRRKAFAPFLNYQFRSEAFITSVREVAVGQTMACLNTQILKGIPVTLPPLPEQTAIAAILMDMDAELAILKRQLSKTHELKQGMMQHLLTGKIRLISKQDATHA